MTCWYYNLPLHRSTVTVKMAVLVPEIMLMNFRVRETRRKNVRRPHHNLLLKKDKYEWIYLVTNLLSLIVLFQQPELVQRRAAPYVTGLASQPLHGPNIDTSKHINACRQMRYIWCCEISSICTFAPSIPRVSFECLLDSHYSLAMCTTWACCVRS
jgi:hypothetical protein